jgi:hypothetical protein
VNEAVSNVLYSVWEVAGTLACFPTILTKEYKERAFDGGRVPVALFPLSKIKRV